MTFSDSDSPIQNAESTLAELRDSRRTELGGIRSRIEDAIDGLPEIKLHEEDKFSEIARLLAREGSTLSRFTGKDTKELVKYLQDQTW